MDRPKASRHLARRALWDCDARARTAPFDTPASPCRCTAVPSMTGRAECARRGRHSAMRIRLRDALPSCWSLADGRVQSAAQPDGRSCRSNRVIRAGCEETVAQHGPYSRGNRIGVGIRIDQHASLRLGSGDLPVGVTQLLMKSEILGFEPVGRAGASALRRTLHADLYRNVENDSQIGLEVPNRYSFHCIQNVGRYLTQAALIGSRRIGKPVAQHPYPLIERRLDDGPDMVVAGRGK